MPEQSLEPLAEVNTDLARRVVGELLLACVARNQGLEVRCATVCLGPQDAAESLSFLLPRTEHPRHLNEHVRVGQVDGEVPDLGEHDAA
jgi:hypothetical protein